MAPTRKKKFPWDSQGWAIMYNIHSTLHITEHDPTHPQGALAKPLRLGAPGSTRAALARARSLGPFQKTRRLVDSEILQVHAQQATCVIHHPLALRTLVFVFINLLDFRPPPLSLNAAAVSLANAAARLFPRAISNQYEASCLLRNNTTYFSPKIMPRATIKSIPPSLFLWHVKFS